MPVLTRLDALLLDRLCRSGQRFRLLGVSFSALSSFDVSRLGSECENISVEQGPLHPRTVLAGSRYAPNTAAPIDPTPTWHCGSSDNGDRKRQGARPASSALRRERDRTSRRSSLGCANARGGTRRRVPAKQRVGQHLPVTDYQCSRPAMHFGPHSSDIAARPLRVNTRGGTLRQLPACRRVGSIF